MYDSIGRYQFNDLCCFFCQIGSNGFCATLLVKKQQQQHYQQRKREQSLGGITESTLQNLRCTCRKNKRNILSQQVLDLRLVKKNTLNKVLLISEMQADLSSFSSKKLHSKSPCLKITTYVCMPKVKTASTEMLIKSFLC